MEPPLKRLRMFNEDYTVDEENPDYIAAKQEQQRKFKNKWEEIFHKFSNMHESMSDDIHLAEERIVKDRGHLRRIDRQARRTEQGMLMKTHGLLTMGEDDEEGDAAELDNHANSEDELAPAHVFKKGRKRGRPKHAAQKKDEITDSKPATATAISIASIPGLMPQVTAIPNPTIQLLRFLPPPETPEGQQARSVFQQILNQQGDTLELPEALPQNPEIDHVAPATDPKWYFPPLSAVKARTTVAQSSPIPSTRSPIAAFQRPIRKLGQAKKPLSTLSQNITQKQVTNEQSVKHDRLRFTSETPDPLMDLEDESALPKVKTEDADEEDDQGQSIQVVNTVVYSISHEQVDARNHLLTPTSLDRESIEKSAVVEQNLDDEPTHRDLELDDEDRELLSLDGEESPEEMLFDDELPVVTSSPAPEDVLPSIELPHAVAGEESDHTEPLEPAGLDGASPRSIKTVEVDEVAEPEVSSPIKSRNRKRSMGKLGISQQSEGEHTLDNQEETEAITFTCETCQSSFQSASRLERHRAFPPKAHVEALRQHEPAEEIEHTPIEAPLTPVIKRETVSPSRTDFLFRTPHTPYAAEKSASGAKSTSKLSRKAFLKQVKQSWRKQPASSSKAFAKPRGFFDTPVKRPSMVDVDSEDELAI